MFSKAIEIQILFLFLLLSFTSCKKKIVEIVPVIETEDLSISGAGDIKYFSFPGSLTGYAASDTNFIYKTVDGGKSWTQVSLGLANTFKCLGLEFFDEQKGMCLMSSSVYVTADGGQNWAFKLTAQFIGISEDGKGIAGREETFRISSLYRSIDKGQSFTQFNTIAFEGDFISGRVTENNVFVFSASVYYRDQLKGKNVNNGTLVNIAFENLTWDENPKDVYYYNGQSFAVGPKGLIAENGRKKFLGRSDPFNSVDGYKDFVVAVGEQTMVATIDVGTKEKWNDVFDINGNGFTNTFYRIRFINASTFYISGNNGLIWKATI